MNGKIPNINIDYIKKLINTPSYQFLPQSTRSSISKIATMYPDLFKEAVPATPEVPEWQKTQQSALEKAYQAEATGIEPSGTVAGLEKYGFIPKDLYKKNIWGIMGAAATFPLQKLMSALYAFPRASSASTAEVYKQLKIGKLTPTELLSDYLKGAKTGAKAFINMPGEYEDYNWAKAYKEMLPGTKFTKKFQWAENFENRGKFKQFLSGLAGSPADIAGLATDIVTDPLTYLSGGLAPGSKTGLRLTKPLIAKGGEVVLPKSAMLGLTPVGRAALKSAVVTKVDDIVKVLAEITPKEAKLMPAIAKFLPKGGMTADVAKNFFTKKVLEDTLTATVKNLPYEQAVKFIDFGGLKFAGKTIIPGYKIAQTTAKPISWLERRSLVNAIEKGFWTGKGIPEEFRPIKSLVEAQMRYRGTQGKALLDDIFKGLDKSQLDQLKDYLWLSSDVVAKQGANKKISTKLLSQLDDMVKKLSPKQIEVAKDYEGRFVKDFLYNFEKGLDIQYTELPKYYPSRYLTEPTGFARYDIGPTVAPFEKQKTLSYAQAQKLIAEGKLKPKGIYEASLQRVYEHTSRSGRAMLTQEAKQFGRPFKTAGYENVGKAVKGLEGWYMPEEFIKPLTNMNKAFYGDEAVRYTMNLMDKGVQVWRKAALFTPGYHFRNFWTDMISGSMEYGPKFLNPRYWEEAIKIKRMVHKPIASLGGMYGDDAAKMLLNSGEMSAGMYAVEAGKGALGKAAKWTPFQLSRTAGVAREDMGRIVASLIEREAGSSTAQAAQAVAKVFFNYQDITAFERNVMKRAAIPFYTWFRKNITRQVELLFSRTGAYAAIPKVSQFVENMSKMPEGYKEYKPEYFADLFAIMTPFRTQEGVPLALNPNFAWQDWSRLNLRDMAAALNPMLKIPIELLGNKEIFFNTPISQGKMVKAPGALNFMKKLPDDILDNFAMKKGSDDKLYMTDKAYYLFRQNPLFYNLARLYPAEPAPKTPYDWLSILAGIKFFPYEEDKSKQYYYQRFINSVNEKIGGQKQMGYEVPTIPQMESVYKEMYQGAVGKKYNIEDLDKLMELLNLTGGNQTMKKYLSMQMQPYNQEVSKASGADLIELSKLLEGMNINVRSR